MRRKEKREQVCLLIVSFLDLLFGILSVFLSKLTVQILAMIASGATLFNTVKIYIQTKKATAFFKRTKPLLLKTVLKISPYIANEIIKEFNKKEKITMKTFFSKLGNELKNNKITTLLVSIETLIGGAGAYGILEFLNLKDLFTETQTYLISVGGTFIVYLFVAIATIYIGRDDEKFAFIRKVVKFLGSDSVVNILNLAKQSEEKNIETQKQIEIQKAEQEKKDEEIYALIQAEKKKAEEAQKRMEIEAYKLAHPEAFENIVK